MRYEEPFSRLPQDTNTTLRFSDPGNCLVMEQHYCEWISLISSDQSDLSAFGIKKPHFFSTAIFHKSLYQRFNQSNKNVLMKVVLRRRPIEAM
jgi:hypothetical protein